MYRKSHEIMNGSFFDRIGIADMEKVHSAVIGWIFSDECVRIIVFFVSCNAKPNI